MKKTAGFYISVLAVITAIAGMAAYVINCQTSYFSKTGINPLILILGMIAVISQIAYLYMAARAEESLATNLIMVISGAAISAATVCFIGSRVYGAASIMTFEMSEQNLSDLTGAVIGIVICLISLIFTLITSFMKTYRTIDD